MKILVVILDNLGDAVMATAVVEPLRRSFPGAQIGFWVKDYAADLFTDGALVDTVHASDPFWDSSPGKPRGKMGPFLKTLKEIQRARYDAALILNTEWRRAAACWWAGIPQRLGYDRRKSRFFLTTAVPFPETKPHFIDEHRTLVETLLRKEIPGEWVSSLNHPPTPKTNSIAIHPFAGDPLKCWPDVKWNDLLRRLHAEQPNYIFTLICGPGEEQRLAAIAEGLPNAAVRILAALYLNVLKKVLAGSRLLIGGDSGPGHIASAVGTPVISLFGPTDPNRSAPRGKNSVTVLKSNRVEDIFVDDVFRLALGFLE